MTNAGHIKAHLLMFGWSILIATSFPAAGLVADKIDAASLTALRFLVASVLFAPFVIQVKEMVWPTAKELLAYAVLAASLVTYFWSLFKALETTTHVNTGAIFTLVPAFTAVAAYLLANSKIDKRMLIALCIGCVGALWVVLHGKIEVLITMNLTTGDVIFFFGCVILSMYSPLIQFFRKAAIPQRSAAYVTLWVMIIGTVYLLSISLFDQGGSLGWDQLIMEDWAVIVYLSIFTTIITFWQLQYCAPILGSVTVMSYTYLIPSIVLVIDLLTFQLADINAIFMGVFLTLISLVLLNVRKIPELRSH